MALISALERKRQSSEFKDSLVNIMRPCAVTAQWEKGVRAAKLDNLRSIYPRAHMVEGKSPLPPIVF